MNLSLVSPAKLNLFLHVTGKRTDGYHELYSLMAPVSLSDRIDMRFEGRGIHVACAHPDVPDGKSNLVYRAAALFFKTYTEKSGEAPVDGVAFRIEKKIPVGGGLGGGSSNAAAALTGLNRAFDRPFSSDELMALGLALGADVPFFIFGRSAIARGIGEKLTACPGLPDAWAVIGSPGVSASTIDVFKKLEFGLTFRPDYIMNTGSNALPFGREIDGREQLHNDLEGPACSLYPGIASAKEEMELLLQRKVYMSGSGSSLFALYPDEDAARSASDRLIREWTGSGKTVILARLGWPEHRV